MDPLGLIVCNSEHWLKCQLPSERKRDQQGIMYCAQCVVCMRSLPGNTGLSFLFLFSSIFWKAAHVCAHSSYPIILKV